MRGTCVCHVTYDCRAAATFSGRSLGCSESDVIAAVALSGFRSVENFFLLGGEGRVRPVFLTQAEGRFLISGRRG